MFSTLPNEIILHVSSCLQILDILKCGQVSRRFRAISNDENLWPKKLNLCFTKVPAGFLQKVLWMSIPEPFPSYIRRYSEFAKGFQTKISQSVWLDGH